MTRTVVDLTERRRLRELRTTTFCCTEADPCYPHRLDALAARLRVARAEQDSLLIAASDVDVMVTDVLNVLDGITRECLPPHERHDDRNTR